MWDDALQIIEQHPAYAPQVYLPYAQWLAEQDRFVEALTESLSLTLYPNRNPNPNPNHEQDRFVEAQAAYTKAGQGEQSLRMLETLTHNAVVEHRFPDAAHYLHLLASERLGFTVERQRADVQVTPAQGVITK